MNLMVSPMNSQKMENNHQAHEEFIRAFYSLLQAARLHANNNEVVLDRFGFFLECVTRLTIDEYTLTMKVSSGHIIIQDDVLIYKKNTKNIIDNLIHYFELRNLEGLHFSNSVKEASLDNVLTFIRALNAVSQEDYSLVSLANELKNKITWVKIVEKPKQAVDENLSFEEEEDKKERAKKDYSHVLASFKEVAGKVASQKRPGMAKTIRAVQTMVSNVLENDEIYTAISTLRVFDDYTFTHSVNVAILSMCIGKRLGLTRRVLERLGLCGLFHDLGKIEVPQEILNKPGKLDDLELRCMQDHSLNSVRLIIKLRASSDRKARILLPPFEHHLKYDLTGYPYTNWRKPLSLFGRILGIVDVHDAITSPRVYRTSTLSPDRALGFIMEGAGKDYDPILVKVFINMLGVYPVGTLLRLSTGELALVIKTSQQKVNRRPIVGLMLPDNKGGYQMGKVIDLSDCDPGTGELLRDITETYHPSTFGIQCVEHIFSSN
jgi:HD-GYP domain-containing protein (c-di-GMP phosphodiesterase class II)